MEEAHIQLADVQVMLETYIASLTDFAIFEVTKDCYAVGTKPSNMSSLDYVHVTRKGNPRKFVCAFGSRCDRVCVTVAKKTQSFSSCPHEHFANILDCPSAEPKEESGSSSPQTPASSSQPSPFSDNPWLKNTSEYRFKHQKMKLTEKDMKPIERQILDFYKSNVGFPIIYQVGTNRVS